MSLIKQIMFANFENLFLVHAVPYTRAYRNFCQTINNVLGTRHDYDIYFCPETKTFLPFLKTEVFDFQNREHNLLTFHLRRGQSIYFFFFFLLDLIPRPKPNEAKNKT